MDAAHFALWWIPAGHIPSVEEAKQRLVYRQQRGESAMAFSFSHSYQMPPHPNVEPRNQTLASSLLNHDGRIFALRSRAKRGDCGLQTLFRYRQQGSRVWATY